MVDIPLASAARISCGKQFRVLKKVTGFSRLSIVGSRPLRGINTLERCSKPIAGSGPARHSLLSTATKVSKNAASDRPLEADSVHFSIRVHGTNSLEVSVGRQESSS